MYSPPSSPGCAIVRIGPAGGSVVCCPSPEMRTRRKSVWVAVGCVVAIFVMLFFLMFSEEPHDNLGFRLVPTNQVREGGSHIVTFRLTSLDGVDVLHFRSGDIIDPTNPTNAFYRRYGLGVVAALAARCPTNFVPTEFRSQTEFAVLAPTNDVWMLQVQLLRQESFPEILRERSRSTWDCLISRKFAGIRQIWSRPWRVSMNYSVLSRPITNTVPENTAH